MSFRRIETDTVFIRKRLPGGRSRRRPGLVGGLPWLAAREPVLVVDQRG